MRREWLKIIIGLIALLMFYETFSNSFTLLLMTIGVVSIFLRNRTGKHNENMLLLIGVSSIALALLLSRLVFVLIVLLVIILIGQFPDLYHTARKGFKKGKQQSKSSEFIMVHFDEVERDTAKLEKNKWFGNDEDTTENIYSWSDVNFTKGFGHTIFDLGNTILPKAQNVILIRKGFGNTKILVPEEVSISLDVSILLGSLIIGEEEIYMKNETFKWQSERYETNARKIKLVANVLVGEVEVIFL